MSEFREKWPEMRMKHLELVQNAVTRMGANSAALKGYCMGIIAALIALAGATNKPKVLILSLPIIAVFAVLDAVYLTLERGFRAHYDHLRILPLENAPDFQIKAASKTPAYKAFFSWSVFGFYGTAALIVVIIAKLI